MGPEAFLQSEAQEARPFSSEALEKFTCCSHSKKAVKTSFFQKVFFKMGFAATALKCFIILPEPQF